MATQRRATQKRLDIRIIGRYVLLAGAFGFYIAKATIEPENITVVKTIDVATDLKGANEHTSFDVPLSESIQAYISETCMIENVPIELVIAMIDSTSKFDSFLISESNDYGLMQINTINQHLISESYSMEDLLDPYLNVHCGIHIIGHYMRVYQELNMALMAYSMGEYGAQKAWANGITCTPYSIEIVNRMLKLKEKTDADTN